LEQIAAIVPFALTSLLIELTPGPNMTYLALVSAQSGRRAGFAAVAGVAIGLAIIGVAAALGLSTVLAASPLAYAVLRWAGVVYLIYLSWDTWRDGREKNGPLVDSASQFFVRGLVTNLLNPKAMVFYVGVLPTFLNMDGDLIRQSVILALVYVLIATTVHVLIVALAGTVQPLLTSPKLRKRTAAVFALMLLGVALWFAWSTR
jgi:threonine/homoserine/homoserine lactone efflux protein